MEPVQMTQNILYDKKKVNENVGRGGDFYSHNFELESRRG